MTGSLTAQQSNLQNAEAYLDEQISSTSSSSTPDSPNGLAPVCPICSTPFPAWRTIPAPVRPQAAVAKRAGRWPAQFNQVSAQLSTVQADLNTSIQNDVASSNQDLSAIATLNQQIVEAQASGGSADQLVDQREKTLENLAGLANFSTTTQADGAVNVSIGGVTMVSGVQRRPTACKPTTTPTGNLQVAGTRMRPRP